jgi:hypothetical protein
VNETRAAFGLPGGASGSALCVSHLGSKRAFPYKMEGRLSDEGHRPWQPMTQPSMPRAASRTRIQGPDDQFTESLGSNPRQRRRLGWSSTQRVAEAGGFSRRGKGANMGRVRGLISGRQPSGRLFSANQSINLHNVRESAFLIRRQEFRRHTDPWWSNRDTFEVGSARSDS